MNPICKLLNISYPIIQGGMGNISNAPLAAAVSDAGGLGMIGCGTMTPDEVEKIIIETKGLTNKPFGINIAINVTAHVDQLIKLVIKHQIPAVSLSAGNPANYIPILHDNNVKVLTVVASVKHAKKAEIAGADIIVAEGFEAAGINSGLELTTFTLVPQISNHVTIPILAAGGIGDGKGLAAALMLGASGVQLGTILIATKESPFHDVYKQQLIESDGTGTAIVGRSLGRTRRILNTPYAKKLEALENSGITLEQYSSFTSEAHHRIGALNGDLENGFMNAGQVIGLITRIASVKEVIEGMVHDANKQMNRKMDLLNGNSNVTHS
ncbi:2-nitropropane dioxygenase [Virgibacillus profundi]|uniref:Probable nitronate monooxygenase n=1 Tax=Virgibacillus profundi TaxID=2024555 RepID=A0A2A2IAZ1_9BACI|nr:DUF561 domain-containing protein [Virgibacillus profundi]PAV28899.1 2-nitropropane dioxygenase [Virgibacillus profundi]PXY53067.1 DUF561 domain-containing protein [Virgibacillus profundi]